MKCTHCGQEIPPQSQFCLQCGTPVPRTPSGAPSTARPAGSVTGIPTAHAPTTMPGAGIPGAVLPGRVRRSAGPSRILLIALLILAAALAGVSGAILHGRQGLTSASAPSANGGALVNANAPAARGGGLTTAQAPPASGGGLVNANAPPANGGGLVNANAPPANGGGLTNATAPPAVGGGLVSQPTAPGPNDAQPTDDVMPYLRALKRIEDQRQALFVSYNQQVGEMFGAVAGGQHLGSTEAATSNVLTQLFSGDPNDAIDNFTSKVQRLVPLTRQLASDYVRLVQEVDGLQNVPGVPPSCRDLQGYYRAALTPIVNLANFETANMPISGQPGDTGPVSSEKVGALQTFITQAPQNISEQSSRLVESQQALTQVFRSHNIQPFFQISDTEQAGNGGMMSAPYVPGH